MVIGLLMLLPGRGAYDIPIGPGEAGDGGPGESMVCE
jgi:hypothetical protein